MSRDLVDLLEKHTSLPDSSTPMKPPKPKTRRGGFRPCPKGCGRFVRARGEEFCTQCRIPFVPHPSPEESVERSEVLEESSMRTSFQRLQELLRIHSAVQPFPEHLLLSEWDAALLST